MNLFKFCRELREEVVKNIFINIYIGFMYMYVYYIVYIQYILLNFTIHTAVSFNNSPDLKQRVMSRD